MRLDLAHIEYLPRAFTGTECVVHLAAKAGGIQFQREGAREVFSANRKITDNVLDACRESRVRRVFLASSLVVYKEQSRPFVETDPHLGLRDRPHPYGWSKITDEVVASWSSEPEVVTGRFGNVYGPGAPLEPGRSTVVHALIDRAARATDNSDFVVWGDGRATRSFIYVEDAARGVVSALENGQPGEAYNIDTGHAITIADLAELIRDLVNPTLNLRFDDSKPSGAPYRVGSPDKLMSLGFTPKWTLAEGIRATVDWYRRRQRSE